MAQTAYPDQENLHHNRHEHLLCWSSILGGLLITLMAFVMLSALGAGVAGLTGEGLIAKETGGSTLATAGGLFLGLSMVISLFCGSYFTLRVARFVTPRVGAAHGFIIASLFFGLVLMTAGNVLGGVSRGLGSLVQSVGGGAANLSQNNAIQDAVDTALGGSTLKADAATVSQGLTNRLLQGDTESAKNYLAYQTGVSREEAEAKITKLSGDVESAAKHAAEVASRAVGQAGLSLFVTFFVGLLGALVGGRVGARSNVDRPFARDAHKPFRNERGSVLPYALGWLMGVPVSLLLLVAVLRSVF